MNRAGLPPAAAALVARIEAMLAEAEAVLARSTVTDDVSYALRETGRRYVPDTLSSYLDIPPSQRDDAAAEMLVGQLTILERATGQRLAALSETLRMQQSANGSFLVQKFGSAESLPAAPERVELGDAPSQALVKRLFSPLDAAAAADPARLLELAAERLAAALPGLVRVTRGLFGGAARALAIDVPVGDRVYRYALARERSGIEATCAKIVRGVALKTDRVSLEEWIPALVEDITTYLERDQAGRRALDAFLRS